MEKKYFDYLAQLKHYKKNNLEETNIDDFNLYNFEKDNEYESIRPRKLREMNCLDMNPY